MTLKWWFEINLVILFTWIRFHQMRIRIQAIRIHIIVFFQVGFSGSSCYLSVNVDTLLLHVIAYLSVNVDAVLLHVIAVSGALRCLLIRHANSL